MFDFSSSMRSCDRHVGDLGRRQIGQFHARLVDRRHLLLLVDLVGHVADGDDQMPRRAAHLADRRGVDVVVAVLAAAERGTGGLAGGQGRVEGAEVGAENLRAAQDGVEVGADDAIAVGPFAQPAVAPDDRVVAVQQDDAVGHAFQNLLVLQQLGRSPRLPEDTPRRRRRRQSVPRVRWASARSGSSATTTSWDSAARASSCSAFSRESQTRRILGFAVNRGYSVACKFESPLPHTPRAPRALYYRTTTGTKQRPFWQVQENCKVRGLVHFSAPKLSLVEDCRPKTWTCPPRFDLASAIPLFSIGSSRTSHGAPIVAEPVFSAFRRAFAAGKVNTECTIGIPGRQMLLHHSGGCSAPRRHRPVHSARSARHVRRIAVVGVRRAAC